jgi:hypothetical protein
LAGEEEIVRLIHLLIFLLQASVGKHELLSRAICETGEEQPLEAKPNPGGFCNNSVQRLLVRCLPSLAHEMDTDAPGGECDVPSQ